jgi:hypothetical protein
VVYASSSSALTTGSALVFDGTNLSVGTQGEVRVYNTANTRYGRFVTTSSGTVLQSFNGSNEPLILDAPQSGAFIRFDIGSTEQMRLTSTGLGIGTSSPNTKLQVAGNAVIGNGTIGAPASGYQLRITSDGTDYYDFGRSSSTGYFISNSSQASPYRGFIWAYGGTAQATLDASGNLGLGVTPSAWLSTTKVMQIGQGACLFGRTASNQVQFGSNFYIDTSTATKYINTDFASKYVQDSGQHQFFTVASGTAGNSITFTQAMTLTADGYFLVGMTTNTRDTTSGSVAFGFNGSSQNGLLISDTGTGSGSNIPVVFGRNGSVVGSIVTTTTGTTYNSGASDYRLKDNIENLDGGLQAICNLRPVKFKWKSNGESDKGFIAHELQQIIPECISGEKDAVDENEKPIYQQISTSTPQMIAMLVSAIQELKTEFDTYKATHP